MFLCRLFILNHPLVCLKSDFFYTLLPLKDYFFPSESTRNSPFSSLDTNNWVSIHENTWKKMKTAECFNKELLRFPCLYMHDERKKSTQGKTAAATCWVGKGVVQTFAQWGSREGERGLNSSVHLHIVLCGRTWSGHPGYIGLPLSDGQLLPQV